MKFHTLSIMIPVYNEEHTIERLVKLVRSVKIPLKKEIIIVDDCSSDNTYEVLKNLKKKFNDIKLIRHKKNSGKGAAIKTAIQNATGEILIVQDADMEYDPKDYVQCITPIIEDKASVVYGSRRLKKDNKQHSAFSFYLGGVLITTVFNILFWQHLTDEPTCYKTFRKDIIKSIKINGNRFEWEPEVTAKIARLGIHIMEVPISYYPRHTSEGKKIKWKDGFIAVWTLLKYRFIS